LVFSCLLWACAPKSHEAGVRHITYWEKWTGFEGASMDRLVARFNQRERERAGREASYRPIEVEKVAVSSLEQKLLIATAGGNPPDVAGNYSFFVPAYADKGALTDLGPLLAAAHIERENYIPHYFDLGVYRGKVWALPVVPASVALHWNKQLFEDAGLDPNVAPRTIEELDAFAEKLTLWQVRLDSGDTVVESGYLPNVPDDRKRLIQVGFLPNEPRWWSYAWGYYFGGKLFADDAHVSPNDAGNLRAYNWVRSYSERLGVERIKRFRSGFGSSSSPQSSFLSGKVAMELQGVWLHNFIERNAPGFRYGAAPFPYPADHPELANTSEAEADVLVIPKDSKHVREAIEFIAFVSSPDNLEDLCLGQDKFTPLRAVSERFWREHPNPNIALFRELGSSPNAFAIPKTGIWNEYNRELTNAVDLIQNLSEPPARALGDVALRMQAAVDRDRKTLLRRGEP
ncbi:MAG TPA: ABC transporter substrate-binding protein, partial [Polyangiaceae bacterium]